LFAVSTIGQNQAHRMTEEEAAAMIQKGIQQNHFVAY
jgi:hypothetical protein